MNHMGCGSHHGFRQGGWGPGAWSSCRCHGQGAGFAGPGWGFHRRFVSAEERKTALQEYLRELQAEAKAVEEELKRLEGEA